MGQDSVGVGPDAGHGCGIGSTRVRVLLRHVHVVACELEVTLVVLGARREERLVLADRGGGGCGGNGVGIRVGVLVRKVGDFRKHGL